MNCIVFFLLFSLLAVTSALAENSVPAAARMKERSEEGTYELHSRDGKKYFLTLVLVSKTQAVLSFIDDAVQVRVNFVYAEFDTESGSYKISEGKLDMNGLPIPTAMLTIDSGKKARLDFLLFSQNLRSLEGSRIDEFPVHKEAHLPISGRSLYRGELGLPDGHRMPGTLTIHLQGSQLLAFFVSDSGSIRREFLLCQQDDELLLTSFWPRNSSFLHLRIRQVKPGKLEGFTVVAGLGRGTQGTWFSRISD